MKMKFGEAIDLIKRKPLVVLDKLIEEFKEGAELVNMHLLNPRLKDTIFITNENRTKIETAFDKQLNERKVRESVPVVCLFHETTSDDSTNLQVLEKVTRIGCFSGKCSTLANEKFEILELYIYVKFGLKRDWSNPKDVEYNKILFKVVNEFSTSLGIEIESNFEKNNVTKIYTAAEKKKYRIEKLSEEIREYYHQEFLKSSEAQEFFLGTGEGQRGFKNADNPQLIIEKFKIGYASQSFPSTALIERFEGEYTTEELIEAGAVMLIQEGKNIVDKHAHSLMIGYWGENMKAIDSRYGRSMDLSIEKKRRHMRSAKISMFPLNFHQVKNRYKKIHAAEGEITGLSLYGMGIHNYIVTFGTNGFKPEYISTLKESGIEEINLIYDADKAGILAALKVGQRLIKNGIKVTVTLLDLNIGDANDYLKKNKKAEFLKTVEEAIPFYRFLMRYEWNGHKSSELIIQKIEELVSEEGLSDATKYTLAEYAALESGMPFDVIWSSVHKVTNNLDVTVLKKESFAYITNNKESYYLMKFASSMCSYVEDVNEVFGEGDMQYRIKLLIVEKGEYSIDDIGTIKRYCEDHGVKVAFVGDFKNYIQASINFEELKKEILA